VCILFCTVPCINDFRQYGQRNFKKCCHQRTPTHLVKVNVIFKKKKEEEGRRRRKEEEGRRRKKEEGREEGREGREEGREEGRRRKEEEEVLLLHYNFTIIH
jgi:hypothetical protein